MNAQQQRYIEIMQKLHEGSQLVRSEQLWLAELLEPLQGQFFPMEAGRRASAGTSG